MSHGIDREVYFEHRIVGHAVKCTAIDAETGIEVSVSGPVSAAPSHLETLALRALQRRLAAGGGRPA